MYPSEPFAPITRVININTLPPSRRELLMRNALPGYRYVGRAKDREVGKYGNRYSHKPSKFEDTVHVRTVEEAIDRYACDKWAEGGFVEMVKRDLKGKVLVCWCRPTGGFQGRLMCHAQVLAGWADGVEPERIM